MGTSNSRPGDIFGTLREGEAVEIKDEGRWTMADVIGVEARWKVPGRSPLVMTRRRAAIRVDDRVTLRLRTTGRIVMTTPWLMGRSLRFRGVQGSLL